jgi:hypothetical protein
VNHRCPGGSRSGSHSTATGSPTVPNKIATVARWCPREARSRPATLAARHPMRSGPAIAPAMRRPQVSQRIAIDVIEIPRLPRQDEPRHPIDREHAVRPPRAPQRPDRHAPLPPLPQQPMPGRPVLQPAQLLRLRRSRRRPPTPLRAIPLIRLTSNKRPATARTLPLLRHEPEPAATRRTLTTPHRLHLHPAPIAAKLPVTPRRKPAPTTLTRLHRAESADSWGEKPKLRGSSLASRLKIEVMRLP